MKIGSLATFMHIVIKTTRLTDLFNIPLCGINNLIHVFFIILPVKCYIDRQEASDPRILAHVAPLSFHLLHFLFILPFVLIIHKISIQIAMRKSTHDVVDVQSLGSRHQMSIWHYWIFHIRITALVALRNSHTALSIRHATPSDC